MNKTYTVVVERSNRKIRVLTFPTYEEANKCSQFILKNHCADICAIQEETVYNIFSLLDSDQLARFSIAFDENDR